jgi:hypothetical protein
MSVEFLKQVGIPSKQPYFYLIFPNKTTSVAMNPHQYQPYYLIYFFNEVMRLVVRENHWLQRWTEKTGQGNKVYIFLN